MSSNKDQELSGTKKDSISKRPEFLHSALNKLGLNSVQKLLAGMLGVESFDAKTSEITDKKRFNITVAGKSVTVITNGGDFGLFEWFPTEIKLKIWKYALKAPRIVSISSKGNKDSLRAYVDFQIFCVGPQNPQLYVNRLTREEAIRRFNHLNEPRSPVIHSKSLLKTTYDSTSDTIWIREIDFWSYSNQTSHRYRYCGYNWMTRSLAITVSSRKALTEWKSLSYLSFILAHSFSELEELIFVMEYLDLTIPGVCDEITFINLTPKAFSEYLLAIKKYSPTMLSLSEEFIIGIIYGEWKPDHWYTSVCSMTQLLKSYFMRKKETAQAIPDPNNTILAKDLYWAFRNRKNRFENPNAARVDEQGREVAKVFRKWTVPPVRFLAATTYKQLEETGRS
ncbi:hypothetical protein BOTCAL_0313g00050 [Botryotinia calthae]|uniref:2EXR domain-containing protein n=1 Tax=Botryotinia calthae TaxID=38488 RepID=A0A4Y8CW78_9HELO|nr:hypothetical protein BOTCAL_0313g00050 [Botryotinia calthae]